MHPTLKQDLFTDSPDSPEGLIALFLGGKKPTTVDAYRRDLADFATFARCTDAADAVGKLCSVMRGTANAIVYQYRADMTRRDLSPATINRRLSALRSVLRMARTVGITDHELDVTGVREEVMTDCSGPSKDDVRTLLGAAKCPRDRLIVRLLYEHALRRGELVKLDVSDVVMVEGRPMEILVEAKGTRQRVPLSLTEGAADDVKALLDTLDGEGPLFRAQDRRSAGGRLSGTAIYMVIRKLGETLGLAVRPHGLRHSGITEAVIATEGDVASVMKFSRHKNPRTVMRYVDRVNDEPLTIAKRIAL